jgi:hypothetical protein
MFAIQVADSSWEASTYHNVENFRGQLLTRMVRDVENVIDSPDYNMC